MNPTLSIIIVNYRSEDALVDCLRSIHVATGANVEVVVIDNSPISPDYQPADGRSAAKVLRDSGVNGYYFPQSLNTGYTKAANLGAQHAHGEYLCFLNPDTVFEQHALDRLVDWVAQHPRTVAGPRELNPAGQIMTTAFPFVTRRSIWGANLLYKIPWPRQFHPWLSLFIPPYRYAGFCRTATGPRQFPVLSGSCLLMSRQVWLEVGEWRQELTYFGLESEWFKRARDHGVTAWYIPDARLYHEHALSIRRGDSWRVREEADRNRRWHAAQFGWWVVGILIAVFWLERKLRPPTRPV